MRRLQLDMSQEELAVKLGYKTRSSINKIESGRNDVTQSKIEAFAKALDTTPAYLMGWEDKGVPTAFLNEYKNSLSKIMQSVDMADVEAAGIDRQKLSDIIEGKKDVSFKELSDLADVLGMEMDDALLTLMGGDSEKKEAPAISEAEALRIYAEGKKGGPLSQEDLNRLDELVETIIKGLGN